MSKQLFNVDIKSMTVSDLKATAIANGWIIAGSKRKAQIQNFIIESSYRDMQKMGIEQMKKIAN